VANDEEKPGYLGAMLDTERRLVLVPVDPEEPWVAFRRMRSWMKRRKVGSRSSVNMFKPPPKEEGAEVIALRTRLTQHDS
jgi:hypothetical protein